MQSQQTVILLFCVYAVSCAEVIFTNVWAVRINNATEVDAIADRHGFCNLGLVDTLEDVYEFKLVKESGSFSSENQIKTAALESEQYVILAEQQYYEMRYYRDPSYSSWRDLLNDSKIRGDETMRVMQAISQGLTGCRVSITNFDAGLINATDLMEAEALSTNSDIIYSRSWRNEGSDIAGPRSITRLALEDRVKKGRDEKGSIYVWSSGSDEDTVDNGCGFDGYSSSPYTISVAAFNANTTPCNSSSTLVSAYGETPAAATLLVSGIISLTLQANENLTWRDVQYLMVYTSNLSLDSDSLTINHANLNVSNQYGFGVIDAEAMVTRARYWTNVPQQIVHSVLWQENGMDGSTLMATFNYNESIKYLEHVVVEITIADWNYIKVELKSPLKTSSILLHNHTNDNHSPAPIKLPIMSVKFWGEEPQGKWMLTVTPNSADIKIHELQLFGVSEKPKSVASIPTRCHTDCRNGRRCANETSSKFCDSCSSLRDADTLECVDECPRTHDKSVCGNYCLKRGLALFIVENDRTMVSGDDNSSELTMTGGSFRYGCENYTKIYVGSNGYISLGSEYTGFTPFDFSAGTGLSLVAPLFADIINGKNDNISYKEYHKPHNFLNRIRDWLELQLNESFDIDWALIATWEVESIPDLNMTKVEFQGILTTDFDTGISYAIISYECSDCQALQSGIKAGFVTRDGMYDNLLPSCHFCMGSEVYSIFYRISGTEKYCNSISERQCTPYLSQL